MSARRFAFTYERNPPLGLQILICSLLAKAVHKVQIVTPKPPSTILVLLKNAITSELKARGVTAVEQVAAQRRDCLDRIMLSRVFDMDGFGEVLADLENAAAAAAEAASGNGGLAEAREVGETKTTGDEAQTHDYGAGAGAATSVEHEPERPPLIVAEIQDSQDEDEPLSPLPTTPPQPDIQERHQKDPDHADDNPKNDTPSIINNNNNSAAAAAAANNHNPKATTATPDIILVTHFSSLLTSFFTQRDKPTAHATLRLLSARLRRLSRTLPSHPLVLLVNSTDSGAAAHSSASHGYENPPPPPPSEQQQPPTYHNNKFPPVAPSLRSIFNPAAASSGPSSTTTTLQSPPSGHRQAFVKPNKPTFGLVFTQLLDLHLLCTRAPRPSKNTTVTATPSVALTVVEVLLDDIGLWEGERGRRRRREQRWTVVAASSHGRIVDAFLSDGEREDLERAE
ncbi:hypothetical protein BBK36DRAFT_1145517 [Trichoderma citrinoviride]|uniref:Uncharacterized protein n=1 Tax=Trichoderma citrinoviride TaxID=58853 RepID=A0A2T4AX66_9HYPO|nr:hypothetical protein BBK36DRAFT_1145517 [Trichoderma citrinoviride]PTB61639.1 hypothetical protein BBK36DRAFT_1145517 [Trichoderma citrinoviride]